MRAVITPGDGDARHGTTNGYSNLKCRCQDCRDAWASWYKADRYAREAQLSRAVPGRYQPEHGKASTYENWLCRCDPCRTAHSAKDRARYLKRKETSRG